MQLETLSQSLFSPKSKSSERTKFLMSGFFGQSKSSMPSSYADAGDLQFQTLPSSSRHLEHLNGPGGSGNILTSYNSSKGTPMMTHGMEFPPEEVISPGEMIVERML
jgi:hypothetical protein